MKVLLGGEGKTDIGDFAIEVPYRETPPRPGVVQTLLERIAGTSHDIVDGVRWDKIRKFRSGAHRQHETRNVMGLALIAKERQCDAIVFVRDRDGDEERQEHVEAGVTEASMMLPHVVGGLAVEAIEAWALALHGRTGSESHTDPKPPAKEVGITGVESFVDHVRQADLTRIPADARSLHDWIARASQLKVAPP